MADTKISDLTALTGANVADDDEFVIVDTSAAQSKRITKTELAVALGTNDTLADVLGKGNTTGGTDIAVSTGDDITFADNSKAIFGAGSDLQIYHDGTDSYIVDSGTGDLNIRAYDHLRLQNSDGTRSYFTGFDTGAVRIYYNGNEKLATTSTGIDVTGGVSIDDDNNFSFGDGTTYIQGSAAADRLKFITNASEAMRIDSSGNVGIGTSSPSFPLSIQSNSNAEALLVLGRSSDDIGEIAFRENDNSTALGEIQYRQDHAIFRHRVGYLSFATGGTSERMRIDSSGNVGIGVSSPADKLSVNGNIKTTVDNTIIAPYGSLLGFVKKGGSAGSIAYASGQSLIFSQSSASSLSDASSETYSERMRIDSSGNLLVGKTSQSVDNVGGEILSTGIGQFTVNGNFAARFTRQTSDGDIVVFRKGTGVVGSIGAASGSTYYTTYASGVTGSGIIGGDGNVLLANKNGASTDGSVDLGASNKRVRNLYLSGGVYVGGTGSANLLDDYEEGTWTPIWECSTSNPTVTYSAQVGRYTKIGNIVYVKLRLTVTSVSGGSGNLLITGLPFTATNDSGALGTATIGYKVNFTGNGPDYGRLINSQIELYYDNNTNEVALTQANLTSSVDCIFAAVYTTTQ